jgi:hypothetical protein
VRHLASVALLVVVASLAITSAGCMGDDGTETSSTAEWADAFCTAVTTWTTEIGRVAENLTADVSAEGVEQAREDLSTATDALIEEVEGLGAPDIESGEEVEEAIVAFRETADAERDEVEQAVDEALEEDTGTSGIAAALGVVGGSLQTMSTALQTMFQAFEDADAGGELNTAFEESEACQEIAS